MVKIKRKNIIDELLSHELSHLDEILEVLHKQGKLEETPIGYYTESAAWCWFERNPSKKAKLEVLEALGYDISKL